VICFAFLPWQGARWGTWGAGHPRHHVYRAEHAVRTGASRIRGARLLAQLVPWHSVLLYILRSRRLSYNQLYQSEVICFTEAERKTYFHDDRVLPYFPSFWICLIKSRTPAIESLCDTPVYLQNGHCMACYDKLNVSFVLCSLPRCSEVPPYSSSDIS